MPVQDPFYAYLRSDRFQTLNWLPGSILRGTTFPSEYGTNTYYPTIVRPKDFARIYWKPQNFAITAASIESNIYGTRSLSNAPYFASGLRPNGGAGPLSDNAYELIWGVGGSVTCTENIDLGGGLSLDFAVSFALIPITALQGGSIYPRLSIAMSLTLIGASGAQVIVGSRVRTSDYTSGGILSTSLCGSASICKASSDPLSAGALVDLWTLVETPVVDYDPAIYASLTIDYSPWIFS